MATIRRQFHISAQLYPAISESSELARESMVLGLQMRIPAYSAEKTAVNLTQESFGQATDSEDL